MEKLKKYKFLILIPIILLIMVSIFYYNKSSGEEINVIEELEVKEEPKEVILETPIIKKIKVDIKGAIKKPGVYEISESSRVIDVINLSGGFNFNADSSTINLSKIVNDEDVIIVYTKEELAKIREGNVVVKYIEKECVCPKLEENKACIKENVATIVDKVETNKLVNINTASKEELMTLTGIGEAKANDIIEYRKSTIFKTIDEIKNIKGIGESVFEKFKNAIEV